jgi:hypothetical protein
MGAVLPIAPPSSVDEAWDAYKRLADQVIGDPLLFTDRAHAQARIRAYRKFEHLFLIGDQA